MFLAGLGEKRGRSVHGTSGKRGLQAGNRRKAPTFFSSSKCSVTSLKSKKKSSFQHFGRITRRSRHRKSKQHSFSRVLQPLFCNAKIHPGEVAPDSRPEILQCQLYGETKIQDGDRRVNKTGSSGRGLGHLTRFQVSIPPHSNSQKLQEVPQILNKQSSVPISSLTHGIDKFSQNFYQSHQGDTGLSPGTRSSSTPVPGRLACESEVQRDSHRTYQNSEESGRGSGISGQYGEIGTGSQTRNSISGLQVFSNSRASNSIRGQEEQNFRDHSVIFGERGDVSVELAVPNWAASVNREVSAPRTTSHQATTNSLDRGVVSYLPASRGSCENTSGDQERTDLVVRQGSCHGRGAFEPGTCFTSCLHRCLPERLGWSLGQLGGSRGMECTGSCASHKCSGNVICNICCLPFQRVSCTQHGGGCNGQYNSNVLHKETGGNTIKTTMENNTNAVSATQRVQHRSDLPPHCGQAQCVGGQVFETRSGPEYRVESASRDSGTSMENMAETNDRLVCDEVQQETSSVRISGAGSGSMGNRRIDSELEPVVRVCVPSDSHIASGAEQDTELRLRDNSGCPSLGETGLVLKDTGSSDRCSMGTSSKTEHVETARNRQVSQGSTDIPLTCVEVIKRSHQEKGFSERVSSRMAQPQKDSTLAIYQAKWNVFQRWCTDNDHIPLEVTSPIVADFLCHLHEDKKLAVSTIEGYRTSISHMLKAVKGLDIGKDASLTSLINNFGKSQPLRKSVVPKWDLSLVLLM